MHWSIVETSDGKCLLIKTQFMCIYILIDIHILCRVVDISRIPFLNRIKQPPIRISMVRELRHIRACPSKRDEVLFCHPFTVLLIRIKPPISGDRGCITSRQYKFTHHQSVAFIVFTATTLQDRNRPI